MLCPSAVLPTLPEEGILSAPAPCAGEINLGKLKDTKIPHPHNTQREAKPNPTRVCDSLSAPEAKRTISHLPQIYGLISWKSGIAKAVQYSRLL